MNGLSKEWYKNGQLKFIKSYNLADSNNGGAGVTIVEFNNLVGEPVYRYRPHYKKMEKLRELFFNRVETDVDLENFIEYYIASTSFIKKHRILQKVTSSSMV